MATEIGISRIDTDSLLGLAKQAGLYYTPEPHQIGKADQRLKNRLKYLAVLILNNQEGILYEEIQPQTA